MSHPIKFTVIALVIPILVLGWLTLYKRSIVIHGKKVLLTVDGYDPRSLLRGHFLTYRVLYPSQTKEICPTDFRPSVYVCLKTKGVSFKKVPYCKPFIKGECVLGRFKAGIERFYIPEKDAKKLDKKLRERRHKATVEISVLENGVAQVTNFFFDGVSWKDIK